MTLGVFTHELYEVMPTKDSPADQSHYYFYGEESDIVAQLQREDISINYDAFLPIPAILCSNRLDILVIVKKEDKQIPLLCIEIHSRDSDSYENTVAKTIASCIDQLRLLRNMDPVVTAITGFTFPRAQCKMFVTKVVVRWEEWRFRIWQTKLPQNQVEAALAEALTENLAILNRLHTVPSRMCMLPLADEELKQMAAAIGGGEGPATQIYSNNSIVVFVANAHKYLKYNPQLPRSPPLEGKLDMVVQKEGEIMFGDLRFAIFPEAEKTPREDIGDKFEYVEKVAAALQTLHKHRIAHLDVRFENICYSSKKEVKFIDFDRWAFATRYVETHFQKYNRAEMYRTERGWTAAHLDWKQFGTDLLFPKDFKASGVGLLDKIPPPAAKFLSELISHGAWVQEAFEQWRASS